MKALEKGALFIPLSKVHNFIQLFIVYIVPDCLENSRNMMWIDLTEFWAVESISTER